MNQTTLFDPYHEELAPPPKPAPGPLSACDKILALLRLRPATSLELSKIDLKYTSRCSELRQRGYNVQAVKTREAATGKQVFVYRLEE